MHVTTGTEPERYGGWIQVFTGRPFWPLDPRPEEIDIQDIAQALSMQCRYAGHVRTFYSVAEHSIHVSRAVPPEHALWGLLHDATEAYLQDIVQPVKAYMPQYRIWEDRLMACIAERFGLPPVMPAVVKEIDRRMLFTERAALLRPAVQEWDIQGEPVPGIEIYGWRPESAFDRFCYRFAQLTSGEG